MASCILHQNVDQTVTLLDIPRSIELAQGFDENQSRRLVSSKPVEQPYPTVEPKSAKAKINVGSPSIKDLLLGRYIEFALKDVKSVYKGPWCYPRVLEDSLCQDRGGKKPQARGLAEEDTECSEQSHVKHVPGNTVKNLGVNTHDLGVVHHPESVEIPPHSGSPTTLYIPPLSTYLRGTIEATLDAFTLVPKFNLVIMDPPWPNRSARRKNSYELSYNTHEITTLLSMIPLNNHLADDALVGVWVTNKPVFHDLLIGPNGFFEKWGLEAIEDWVWLKVTAFGDPICAVDSSWRKPYEILLIGRRLTDIRKVNDLKRRIIMAVPDLHSRKPNLRELLEPILPSKYHALEIFGRNLTTGWWAWGDEVLKFQHAEHWIGLR
jgi:N6-adenosine-specific RNA methylase IME4